MAHWQPGILAASYCRTLSLSSFILAAWLCQIATLPHRVWQTGLEEGRKRPAVAGRGVRMITWEYLAAWCLPLRPTAPYIPVSGKEEEPDARD